MKIATHLVTLLCFSTLSLPAVVTPLTASAEVLAGPRSRRPSAIAAGSNLGRRTSLGTGRTPLPLSLPRGAAKRLEGEVQCCERLGGLLRYYYRDAAWVRTI